MSFTETKLLRHPTVEKAYALVTAHLAEQAASQTQASEVYGELSDAPAADVAAALLFRNTAIHDAKKVNPAVARLADVALREGYDGQDPLADNTAHADIALAVSIVMARDVEEEIIHSAFYVFRSMQHRIGRLDARVAEAAAISSNPRLVSAAQEAIVAMQVSQTRRIDKARADSVFEKSGLPAHPLIEKVYNAERYHDFQVKPHVMPLSFELAAARILVETLDKVEPEMLAAALLNQVFGPRAARIGYLYGARVAKLQNETAPQMDGPSTENIIVKGAADIRAAFGIVALQSWMGDCARVTPEHREEVLCDIEEKAKQFRVLIKAGQLSPAMARRLETEAAAAEALVHAPQNTAIRKPGTPRPLIGW